MSLSRLPTQKEITANFDKALKDARDLGIGPPSDQGFDDITFEALREVARNYPNFRSDLIEKAKEELRGQFDGTHRALESQRLADALAALRR